MNHAQASRFIRACVRYIGIGFHPDIDFQEYESRPEEFVFTVEAAQRHNDRLFEAFKVLDNQIYDIAHDEMMRQYNKLPLPRWPHE